jgi:hypothetical protein
MTHILAGWEAKSAMMETESTLMVVDNCAPSTVATHAVKHSRLFARLIVVMDGTLARAVTMRIWWMETDAAVLVKLRHTLGLVLVDLTVVETCVQ